MSAAGVRIPPAAGLAAAAVAFAVVLLATDAGEATARAAAHAAAPAARADRDGRARLRPDGLRRLPPLAAAGSRGAIGPSLDDALADHTRASLRAKIFDPGTGSVMPQDFARRMSSADLDALVGFLLAARAAG